MGQDMSFFPKFCALCHAKSMLFIDDHQAQLLVLHILFDEGVCTNEDVNIAFCKLLGLGCSLSAVCFSHSYFGNEFCKLVLLDCS